MQQVTYNCPTLLSSVQLPVQSGLGKRDRRTKGIPLKRGGEHRPALEQIHLFVGAWGVQA